MQLFGCAKFILNYFLSELEKSRRLSVFRRCPTMTANGLALCEEAELEAQMFNFVQKFIRIPNVQFSPAPAFLQNPC